MGGRTRVEVGLSLAQGQFRHERTRSKRFHVCAPRHRREKRKRRGQR